MDFMTVLKHDSCMPCAYYINSKRVCKEVYDHFDQLVSMYGTFSCIHTTRTKITYQYRKVGNI